MRFKLAALLNATWLVPTDRVTLWELSIPDSEDHPIGYWMSVWNSLAWMSNLCNPNEHIRQF